MNLETGLRLSIIRRLGRLPGKWQVGPGLGRGLGMFGLLLTLWGGYTLTGKPVNLVIDGQPHQIRTHQQTVEAMLQSMDLKLYAEDIVQPPLNASLSAGDSITIQLARPVSIEVDGRILNVLTQQQSLDAIMTENELTLNRRDEIFINDNKVPPDSSLPPPQFVPSASANRLFAATTPSGAVASSRPEEVQLVIQRAILVTLHDEQTSSTFYTTRTTIGEALAQQGITLFPEDNVTPNLDTRPTSETEIFIKRSTPVTLMADGHTIETRTQQETVGAVLAQKGIALMGQDFTHPPTDQPISTNETIEIVRVRETIEIEQDVIPFETKWIPDEALPLDRQEVRQTGAGGVIKTRSRVRYENGQEVWREIEDEWLDQEPRDHLIAYGTKITIQTLETEDGPIEYWRKIPMLTTAYSAATSGKAPDHPRYGITRTGMQAGYGIVAVDPKVIPLLTNVYVPGYGKAIAGDTGGGVLGKHIDLGYDDDKPPPLLYEWRDVYVLTPVPPADQIRYVLPQWPQRQ